MSCFELYDDVILAQWLNNSGSTGSMVFRIDISFGKLLRKNFYQDFNVKNEEQS